MKNKKNFIGILTGIGVIIPALSLAASCGSKTTANKETKTKEEQTLENALMNLNYTNKSETEFTAIEQASADLNEDILKNLGLRAPDNFPVQLKKDDEKKDDTNTKETTTEAKELDAKITVTKAKNSKVVKYEYTIGKLKGSVEVTFKFFRTKEMDDFLKKLEDYNETSRTEDDFTNKTFATNDDAFTSPASLNYVRIQNLSGLKAETEKFGGKMKLQLNKPKTPTKDLTYVGVYTFGKDKTIYLEKTVTFTTFLKAELKNVVEKLLKLRRTNKTKNDFLPLAKTDLKVIEGTTIHEPVPHDALGLVADSTTLPSSADLGGDANAYLNLSKSADSDVLVWKIHYADGAKTFDYTLKVKVTGYPYTATYDKALALDWSKATEVNWQDIPTGNLQWNQATTVIQAKVSEADGGQTYYLAIDVKYKDPDGTAIQIQSRKSMAKNLDPDAATKGQPNYLWVVTNAKESYYKEVRLYVDKTAGATIKELAKKTAYADYVTHVDYVKFLQPSD